jgi:hypothetical protein
VRHSGIAASPFGSGISPWLDYIVGGWTFSGTGRVQIQDFVLRNSVLVGMTHEEAQQALKEVRFVTDASGVTTVWNFPQDIIDNTRKAYNTDETQPTFYTPGQEPTGRYFAPAGGPACNFLYLGDCNALARVPRPLVRGVRLPLREDGPAAGQGPVRDQRGSIQRPDGEELPEPGEPERQLERLHQPQHIREDLQHAERGADSAAGLPCDLLKKGTVSY